ncbi:MAG: 50S ribosomal protein L19 [Candidatus Moranbacteria bacterium]|nr:50S ribosomal protein L19 [Candidatus Moranbacteria bacterium]
MHEKVIAFNKTQRTAQRPDLRAGDVVRVARKIVEGTKERVQTFEGMVLAIRGGQSSSPMITVRKVSFGVGVEIVFPLYSPQIQEVELVKRAKVRRAKLNYIRNKTARALRFKFTPASELASQKEETPSDNVSTETESTETSEEKVVEKKAESKEKTESAGEEKK